MARRKEMISQNDFSYGSVRPEAVEREDTPLVLEGLRAADNTLSLTTGTLAGRPGSLHFGSTAALNGVEVDLGQGRVFDIHISEDGVVIYAGDGSVSGSFLSNTWDDLAGKYGTADFDPKAFWVLPDPETSAVLIGASSYPTHALSLSTGGVWSFGLFEYADGLSGSVRQPYWPYFPDVDITPSARSGAISIVASSGVFTAGLVGARLRYGGREIEITGFTDASNISGTVIEELPPTYDFVVAAASGYQVGDAVEHETLGGQGVITGISGTTITVFATALWDGFAASDKLVAPNAKQTISGMTTVSPSASNLWDLQAANQLHGYPGWGTKHKGRAFFCQYPSAPNAFSVSVAQRIDDFTMGVDDGDGFMEALGANLGGDLLYIISAEDLLFFTTRGLYYQPTRGGEDITPSTIGPIPFSSMGCSSVVPVVLDDGAVFVDAVGEQVYAAVLAGDVQRSWRTQNISLYHSHLISSPVFLGATSAGSARPESFVFAINSDGTAAVCQWDRTANKVGWRPWITAGRYKSIYQAFGSIWSVVDRAVGGFTGVFRERFTFGVYLDCASAIGISGVDGSLSTGQAYEGTLAKLPAHLFGLTPAVYLDGWDLGDLALQADGTPLDADAVAYEFPTYAGFAQVGLPFTIRVTPWPRRSTQSQRGPREIKRTVKTFITVLDTLAFKYQGYQFGGYRVGEDLSVPPVVRTEEFDVIVSGRSDYEDRPIIVDRPGPFTLLKLRHKVTV